MYNALVSDMRILHTFSTNSAGLEVIIIPFAAAIITILLTTPPFNS